MLSSLTAAELRCFLISTLIALSYASINSTYDVADETFRLLSKGDTDIQLGDNYDLILLLGNTGTGKSTLVKFVTGAPLVVVHSKKNRDLIITDGGQSIGNNTVVSKTLLPEVHVDPITKQVLVDLAGFSDTRNESIEIAAAYYLNKVVNQARSVKLVFTTTHSSVRSGNERRLLTDLLKNVVKMLTNVIKFQDAIALIVTKVDNANDISDEDEMEYIREYLIECKEGLYHKLNAGASDIETLYLEKSILLLDILIDNTFGEKIGLFRRPDQVGNVSESQMLEKNKEKLQKLLFHDLKFVNTSKDDFKYSLTSDALLYIETTLLKSVDDNIITALDSVNYNLKTSIFSLGQMHVDHKLYFNILSQIYAQLFDKVSEINNEEDLILFVHTAINLTKNNTIFTQENIAEIVGKITQSIFFRKFVQYTDNKFVLAFQNKGMEIVNLSRYIKLWYSIIVQIQDAFFIHKSHVERLEKGEKFMINITDNNTENILSKLSKFSFLNSKDVSSLLSLGFKLTPFIIRDLNETFNYYFREGISSSCLGDTVFIRSNFILMSSLTSQHLGVCNLKEKSITIFAENKIFIDVDVNFLDRNLNMIATTWQAMGKNKIQLLGTPAKRHSSNMVTEQLHGKPGFPGNPGPNFIGIALKVENGKNLEVISKGGDGSRGQDGKNGIDGIDADPPNLGNYFFEKTRNDLDRRMHGTGYSFEIYKRQKSDKKFTIIAKNTVKHFWKLKVLNNGNHKQPVGGGNGGAAGLGGSPGNIYLQVMNGTDVITSKRAGKNGDNGKGGRQGIGKYRLAIKYYDCDDTTQVDMAIIVPVYINTEIHCNVRDTKFSGKDSNKDGGKNGANLAGRIKPASAQPLNIKPQITMYQNFQSKTRHLFIFQKSRAEFLDLLKTL